MSIKSRGIKKVGIATVVTFTCLSTLSSMNLTTVQAAEQQAVGAGNSNTADSNTERQSKGSEILERENKAHSTEGSREALKNIGNNTEEKSDIYKDDSKVPGESKDQTVEDLAKDLEKNNDLGIASAFHIFSKNAKLDADTNGNIATNHLNNNNGHRLGTRNSDNIHKTGNKYNQTSGDIYYIKDATRVGSNAFCRDDGDSETQKVIVLGNDLIVGKCDNGNHYSLKNDQLDHVLMKQEIKNDSNYIDIGHELNKLSEKSSFWNKQSESKDEVEKDFQDFNKQGIKILKDKVQSNHIYVDLDFSVLHDHATPITISGISTEKNGPVIIINVKYTDSDDLNNLHVAANKVVLRYTDGKSEENSEFHTHYNHVLWNFGTQAKKITFEHQFSGSVLAPNAEINFVGGVYDGNVIGNTVNVSGQETHRWDLVSAHNILPYPGENYFVDNHEGGKQEIDHHEGGNQENDHHESDHHEGGNQENDHHESDHHEGGNQEIDHHESDHHEGGNHENDHHESDHHEGGNHENDHHEIDHHEGGNHENDHHESDHHESGNHEGGNHKDPTPSHEEEVPPTPETPENPTPNTPKTPNTPNTPPNIPEGFVPDHNSTYTYSFAKSHGVETPNENNQETEKKQSKSSYTRTVRDKADSVRTVNTTDAKTTDFNDDVVSGKSKTNKVVNTTNVVASDSNNELPKTGANAGWMMSLIGFATFALGAIGLKLNKKNR